MKPFGKAVLLAIAIVLAPGLDWSFVTRTPPRTWHYPSAFFYISTFIPPEFEPAIDEAATTWNAAGAAWFFTPASFAIDAQYGVRDGLSVIDYTTPSDPTIPGETSVFTSGDDAEIVEVDTALNPSLPLSTGFDPNSYDVQSVSTHELGHWLELLHSQNPGDVMFERIDKGQIKRDLSSDDIEGIQFLYPPAVETVKRVAGKPVTR